LESFRLGWGLICGDGWSLLEGAVICRQLGLGFAQGAPQTDYFGGKVEDLVTTGVKCTGQEEELAECYHHDVPANQTVFCPGNGRNFASVICTDRMRKKSFMSFISYPDTLHTFTFSYIVQ
jgi:lysyl oxidase-like protein 2/3/4